jgi:ankyrin repeat protein
MYVFRDLMCLFQTSGTALHFAALKGHLPVVELLFERAPQLIEMQEEVSVSLCVLIYSPLTVLVSQDGFTALHVAAFEGHLPVVELLFERAPQLIEMQEEVSVSLCVLICSPLTVLVSQNGFTALHLAAQEGSLAVVEFLFEHAPHMLEMRTNVSATWCISRLSSLSDSVCVSAWLHSPPLGSHPRSPPGGGVVVQARTSID